MTNLEKNQELFRQIQNLQATGKVVVELRPVWETSYGTGSLDAALQRQVVIETVHTLLDSEENENIEEVQVPIQRVKMVVLKLDNHETLQRKIDIANERLEEIRKAEQVRENLTSENLFDFLDANLKYSDLSVN